MVPIAEGFSRKVKKKKSCCVGRSMIHRLSVHHYKNVLMSQQISDTNHSVNRTTFIPGPATYNPMSYTFSTSSSCSCVRDVLREALWMLWNDSFRQVLSYEFFPNYSTKHCTREKKRERGRDQTKGKKFFHICMLIFLRSWSSKHLDNQSINLRRIFQTFKNREHSPFSFSSCLLIFHRNSI